MGTGMVGAMGAPRRNFGLDALRCLAIAAVLANHAFIGFFVELGDFTWTGTRQYVSISSSLSIEWLFVLSGFLIGTMLIRSFEAQGTFRTRAVSFWLRRWFRTVPNYVLFLLVNAAIFSWGLSGPLAVGPFKWRYAFFSQNLWEPEAVPFFFNEAWSLALDEWFYLVLPLLVGLAMWLGKRDVRKGVLVATIALIALPTVLRLLKPVPDNPLVWDHEVRRMTLYHLDATGWGVLAAAQSRWWPQHWQGRLGRRALLGAALMVVGIASIQSFFGVLPWHAAQDVLTAWPRFPTALAFTCTGLGTFLALPWVASLPSAGAAARGAVERVSNYTYSIYLAHFPILYVMAEVISRNVDGPYPTSLLWAAAALWLVLVLWVSAGIHHAFEKPVSDLRERFTRRIDASPFGPATPP